MPSKVTAPVTVSKIGFATRSVGIESQDSARIQRQAAGDSGASKAASGNREHPAIGEVSAKRRPSRKVKHGSCRNAARHKAGMSPAQSITPCGESEHLKVRVPASVERDTCSAHAQSVCVVSSVERPKIDRSEVQRIVAFAEVDGDTSRYACIRESHTISARQGQDVTGDGAPNSDTIRRCSTDTIGNSGSDSGPRAGDCAPGIDDNIRPGSCLCDNTESDRARDRGGRDSRRSTARIAGKNARPANRNCARTAIDYDSAGCSCIAETRTNAGAARRRGCDIGGCDADTARPGSGIGGRDGSAAKVVTHHGPAACVDSDATVSAIGDRTYPAIAVPVAGDSAKRGCVSDVDIAASASCCIGVDSAARSAGDSVGCSDSLNRDVAAARDSLDTAPAGSEHRMSATNRDVAARRGSTDSATGVSGDRATRDSDTSSSRGACDNAACSAGDNAELSVDGDISGGGVARNARRECVNTSTGHDGCWSATLADDDSDSIDTRSDGLGDAESPKYRSESLHRQAGYSAWQRSL